MIEDGKEIPKDKVLRSSCLLHIQTASFFGADKHYPLNDTPVLAFLEQGLLPGSERVKFQLQPSLQDFFLLLYLYFDSFYFFFPTMSLFQY